MDPWSHADAMWAERIVTAEAPPSLDVGWLPVLGRVPMFRSLSRRHLRRIARLTELRRFTKGADVVRAGARGNVFYIILVGRAQVTTPRGRGRTLGPGDWFGELALLDGAPRAATVTALERLTTARISRAAFRELLDMEPSMGLGLCDGLVAIIRDLQGE